MSRAAVAVSAGMEPGKHPPMRLPESELDIPTVADALRRARRDTGVLQGLSPSDLDTLASVMLALSFRQGDVIFVRGEPATWIGIVLSGSMRAMLADGSGHEVPVGEHGVGSFIGLSKLSRWRNSHLRAFTLRAFDAGYIAILTIEQLANLQQSRPQLHCALLKVACEHFLDVASAFFRRCPLACGVRWPLVQVHERKVLDLVNDLREDGKIFANFDSQSLASLACRLRIAHWPARELVQRQGTPSTGSVLVLDGHLTGFADASGPPSVWFGPGDVVGLENLLGSTRPVALDVFASRPTVGAILLPEDLVDLSKDCPKAAMQLVGALHLRFLGELSTAHKQSLVLLAEAAQPLKFGPGEMPTRWPTSNIAEVGGFAGEVLELAVRVAESAGQPLQRAILANSGSGNAAQDDALLRRLLLEAEDHVAPLSLEEAESRNWFAGRFLSKKLEEAGPRIPSTGQSFFAQANSGGGNSSAGGGAGSTTSPGHARDRSGPSRPRGHSIGAAPSSLARAQRRTAAASGAGAASPSAMRSSRSWGQLPVSGLAEHGHGHGHGGAVASQSAGGESKPELPLTISFPKHRNQPEFFLNGRKVPFEFFVGSKDLVHRGLFFFVIDPSGQHIVSGGCYPVNSEKLEADVDRVPTGFVALVAASEETLADDCEGFFPRALRSLGASQIALRHQLQGHYGLIGRKGAMALAEQRRWSIQISASVAALEPGVGEPPPIRFGNQREDFLIEDQHQEMTLELLEQKLETHNLKAKVETLEKQLKDAQEALGTLRGERSEWKTKALHHKLNSEFLGLVAPPPPPPAPKLPAAVAAPAPALATASAFPLAAKTPGALPGAAASTLPGAIPPKPVGPMAPPAPVLPGKAPTALPTASASAPTLPGAAGGGTTPAAAAATALGGAAKMAGAPGAVALGATPGTAGAGLGAATPAATVGAATMPAAASSALTGKAPSPAAPGGGAALPGTAGTPPAPAAPPTSATALPPTAAGAAVGTFSGAASPPPLPGTAGATASVAKPSNLPASAAPPGAAAGSAGPPTGAPLPPSSSSLSPPAPPAGGATSPAASPTVAAAPKPVSALGATTPATASTLCPLPPAAAGTSASSPGAAASSPPSSPTSCAVGAAAAKAASTAPLPPKSSPAPGQPPLPLTPAPAFAKPGTAVLPSATPPPGGPAAVATPPTPLAPAGAAASVAAPAAAPPPAPGAAAAAAPGASQAAATPAGAAIAAGTTPAPALPGATATATALAKPGAVALPQGAPGAGLPMAGVAKAWTPLAPGASATGVGAATTGAAAAPAVAKPLGAPLAPGAAAPAATAATAAAAATPAPPPGPVKGSPERTGVVMAGAATPKQGQPRPPRSAAPPLRLPPAQTPALAVARRAAQEPVVPPPSRPGMASVASTAMATQAAASAFAGKAVGLPGAAAPLGGATPLGAASAFPKPGTTPGAAIPLGAGGLGAAAAPKPGGAAIALPPSGTAASAFPKPAGFGAASASASSSSAIALPPSGTAVASALPSQAGAGLPTAKATATPLPGASAPIALGPSAAAVASSTPGAGLPTAKATATPLPQASAPIALGPSAVPATSSAIPLLPPPPGGTAAAGAAAPLPGASTTPGAGTAPAPATAAAAATTAAWGKATTPVQPATTVPGQVVLPVAPWPGVIPPGPLGPPDYYGHIAEEGDGMLRGVDPIAHSPPPRASPYSPGAVASLPYGSPPSSGYGYGYRSRPYEDFTVPDRYYAAPQSHSHSPHRAHGSPYHGYPSHPSPPPEYGRYQPQHASSSWTGYYYSGDRGATPQPQYPHNYPPYRPGYGGQLPSSSSFQEAGPPSSQRTGTTRRPNSVAGTQRRGDQPSRPQPAAGSSSSSSAARGGPSPSSSAAAAAKGRSGARSQSVGTVGGGARSGSSGANLMASVLASPGSGAAQLPLPPPLPPPASTSYASSSHHHGGHGGSSRHPTSSIGQQPSRSSVGRGAGAGKR